MRAELVHRDTDDQPLAVEEVGDHVADQDRVTITSSVISAMVEVVRCPVSDPRPTRNPILRGSGNAIRVMTRSFSRSARGSVTHLAWLVAGAGR